MGACLCLLWARLGATRLVASGLALLREPGPAGHPGCLCDKVLACQGSWDRWGPALGQRGPLSRSGPVTSRFLHLLPGSPPSVSDPAGRISELTRSIETVLDTRRALPAPLGATVNVSGGGAPASTALQRPERGPGVAGAGRSKAGLSGVVRTEELHWRPWSGTLWGGDRMPHRGAAEVAGAGGPNWGSAVTTDVSPGAGARTGPTGGTGAGWELLRPPPPWRMSGGRGPAMAAGGSEESEESGGCLCGRGGVWVRAAGRAEHRGESPNSLVVNTNPVGWPTGRLVPALWRAGDSLETRGQWRLPVLPACVLGPRAHRQRGSGDAPQC